MEQIKKILKEREEYLLRLKGEKEKALKNAPEGFLRVCRSKNRTQYYQRINPKDCNGTYIKEKDINLARKLAQKDYDQKIVRAIETELESIKRYLTHNPKTDIEQIYENLHKERRKLIIPIKEPEDDFVQRWRAVTYEGKGFAEGAPEFYTAREERVRSKSEWIIAELLEKEGIPYRYEYPIYLKGIGKIYPDFTVLNVKKRKEIYWEHFGMMDCPDYAEKAVNKIQIYEHNGIFPGENLLITYETGKTSINQKIILKMIHKYLQ